MQLMVLNGGCLRSALKYGLQLYPWTDWINFLSSFVRFRLFWIFRISLRDIYFMIFLKNIFASTNKKIHKRHCEWIPVMWVDSFISGTKHLFRWLTREVLLLWTLRKKKFDFLIFLSLSEMDTILIYLKGRVKVGIKSSHILKKKICFF